MEPSLGSLTVHFVEAQYDEEFVSGTMDTYCVAWLLEKTKWRRRKSKPWGRAQGDAMHPEWGEEFEFSDVRDDSKVVVDVYNKQPASPRDTFIGKVTLRLTDLLTKPAPAWHDLVLGQLHVQLSWTELTATGDASGAPTSLTLPPELQPSSPTRKKPSAVPAPAPAPAPSKVMMPPPRQPKQAAAPPPPPLPVDDAEEVDEVETYDDEFEQASPPQTRAALPAVARGGPRPAQIEYWEYTHRGGTGNGPKENQDAYFTLKFDEHNYVFAVLDGHGGENGRVASQAASQAMQAFLKPNFDRLRTEPEAAMRECFEKAHKAIYTAIKSQPDTFEKDMGDGKGPMLVTEVDEEDWELGYDAVDGGSTASVAAVLDGKTLVYAAVGDSCSLFAVPGPKGEHAETKTVELLPEHSPTNLDEWASRLHKSGIHVVYDHPEMFDDPDNLLNVFEPDKSEPSGWKMSQTSIERADAAGCGFKTERGDRAAMLVTPEDGPFSQMMLGVTRSLGDFYHQRYGVTWEPEVVSRPLADYLDGGSEGLICLASDGFWDHWTFEDAMAEVCEVHRGPGTRATTKKKAFEWFDETRVKGAEAFGDHADNLTSIIATVSIPK